MMMSPIGPCRRRMLTCEPYTLFTALKGRALQYGTECPLNTASAGTAWLQVSYRKIVQSDAEIAGPYNPC